VRRYTATADAYRIGGTWWVWKRACGEPINVTASGIAPVTGNLNRYACPSGAPLGMPQPFVVPLSAAYPQAAPGRLATLHSDADTGAITPRRIQPQPGRQLPAGAVAARPGTWRATFDYQQRHRPHRATGNRRLTRHRLRLQQLHRHHSRRVMPLVAGQPGGVDGKDAGREVPQSGVFAAADAVFDAGMRAVAGIEMASWPSGVSVAWAG
jgi:hypothetical protein